jgi:hypothetical protein
VTRRPPRWLRPDADQCPTTVPPRVRTSQGQAQLIPAWPHLLDRDAAQVKQQAEPLVENKQIPGKSAEDPIHRLFHDKDRRKANRREATSFCKVRWPGYPDLGQDCDEYSFACTYAPEPPTGTPAPPDDEVVDCGDGLE